MVSARCGSTGADSEDPVASWQGPPSRSPYSLAKCCFECSSVGNYSGTVGLVDIPDSACAIPARWTTVSTSLSSGRHSTGRVKSATATTSTDRGKTSAPNRCPHHMSRVSKFVDQGTSDKSRCTRHKYARHDVTRAETANYTSQLSPGAPHLARRLRKSLQRCTMDRSQRLSDLRR